MAINFRSTISLLSSFIAVAFRNGLGYRNFDYRRFNGNDFSTLFVNLVIFGPVTAEFMKVVGIHPSSISRYVRLATPLLGTATICSHYSVLFHYCCYGATLLCRTGYTLSFGTFNVYLVFLKFR